MNPPGRRLAALADAATCTSFPLPSICFGRGGGVRSFAALIRHWACHGLVITPVSDVREPRFVSGDWALRIGRAVFQF